MLKRYHYLILSHQKSLGSGAAKPFAVLVESDRYVYGVLYHLDGDTSTVTGQILQNFHAILAGRVNAAAAAVRGKRGKRALDVLHREFAWNITGTPVTWTLSFQPIETFAHALFTKRVDGHEAPSVVASMGSAVAAQFTNLCYDLKQQALITA